MNVVDIVKKPSFLIFGIWLVLTFVNIGKGFHADDGFHLEAAEHIVNNPMHPMSGIVRWDSDVPEPIYKANQPPFLFYLIAGTSAIFGFKEIPMHLMISIFTFLALFWFYKIVTICKYKRPMVLLALFAFCPAFIVNQNLMTDIPVLAFLLGAFYYHLLAEETNKSSYLIIAMVLLTIGVFTKYIFIPIIFAFALIWILKKDFQKIKYLLIPILFLVIWSVWNIWDFGGVHLFDRKTKPLFSRLKMLYSYFSCIGSITVFGLLVLNYFKAEVVGRRAVYWISGILILSISSLYFLPISYDDIVRRIMEIIFIVNGIAIVFLLAILSLTSIRREGLFSFLSSREGSFLILIVCISAFIILFAPFIATRHLLLIIPFVILALNKVIEVCNKHVLKFTIASSFVLSILLGISDWLYADFYRTTAKQIGNKMPDGTTVWATGTGGWQWYAKQNKMKQYDIGSSVVKAGDYLLVAKGMPHYRIETNYEFSLLGKMIQEANLFTFFNVNNGFSMYHTYYDSPSWTLSKKTFDTIYVLQCLGEKQKK